ncbi:MAG: EscU/YscU/HrcU family type III secretion system export apparatus switch protein [Alphaproteobacteria bacterium]|nr:EscU/YscU/HrcU family type III secretion system export apparatus switch protein [Alphaproteobacteria bacterium]
MLGSLAPWRVKSLGDYAQKRRHQASREQVAEGWINLVKGLAKIAIVGVAICTQLWPERGGLEAILNQTAGMVVSNMMHLLFKVLMAALSALAVIAGADYFWQRMRFLSRNRMSTQEIKEEYGQNKGDPAIKAKIRQLRHERSRKRMMAAVPTATVVIMNPTHFAVALRDQSGKTAAPICVAKGVDALALRIRAVAEENDVPVVASPTGARAARRHRDRRAGAGRAFQGGGASDRIRHAVAGQTPRPRELIRAVNFLSPDDRTAFRVAQNSSIKSFI